MNDLIKATCCVFGLLITTALSAAAHAAVEMEMVAVDGDVLLTSTGTLNLSDTSDFSTAGLKALSAIDAAGQFSPSAVTGSNIATEVRVECGGVTGPTTLGSGDTTWKADEGSGKTVGIYGAGESLGAPGDGLCLVVPKGYVSGAKLAGSARFINASLSSLGVTKGTYQWAWGEGATADSLTLHVGAKPPPIVAPIPVPKPVPTLPVWFMLAMAMLLALLGATKAHRWFV
jgi:hypothetical protein